MTWRHGAVIGVLICVLACRGAGDRLPGAGVPDGDPGGHAGAAGDGHDAGGGENRGGAPGSLADAGAEGGAAFSDAAVGAPDAADGAAGTLAPLPSACTFLLLGQSNMAGSAAVAQADMVALPRVSKLTWSKAWRPGAEPFEIASYSPESTANVGEHRMGPTRALAAELMRLLPDAATRSFFMVNAAVPGSAIASWDMTTAENWVRMLPFFDEGVRRAPLCGVFWQQGEADWQMSQTEYQARLSRVIKNVRDRVERPDLPVVVGEVGIAACGAASVSDAQTLAVNRAVRAIAAADSRVAVVSMADTVCDNFDGKRVHYDAASQRLLGQRHAQAFVGLLAR